MNDRVIAASPGRARTLARWPRAHIGILCAVAVFVYCAFHAFDPPRLNWGDPESDYGVLTAGRNFQRYGFLKLHLTPYLLDPSSMTRADRALIYTHYPQLPDLMNGVERVAFGLSHLWQFRLVSLCFAFGGLIFVYRLVAAYWSVHAAEATVALWAVNPLWVQHADNLHHAPYAYFFGAGTVYFLSRHLRGSPPRTRFAVLAGVFLFFTFMSSYDFWFFVPLLLAAVTYAHYGEVNASGIRLLAALAASALAAIAFKWATNAWALGGVHGWLSDLRYQITERSTNDAVNTAYRDGMLPIALGRIQHYFSLLLLAVTAFWALAPVWRRLRSESSEVRLPAANPLVVLGCALPFLCIFSELWVEQVYPTLLLVSFYAVASGVLVSLLITARTRSLQLVGVVLAGALAWNSLDDDLGFTRTFFDRRAISALRAELDSSTVPGQRVLVNHVFDGAYRYYFDRATVAMIATPPGRMDAALAFYTDPSRSPAATAQGAYFVQHKRVAEQLFDKSYYFIVARYHLWQLWASPETYRSVVDSLIDTRDAQLEAAVARRGRKVHETPYYTVWWLPPTGAGVQPNAPRVGELTAAPEHQAHLTKVDR